MTLYVNHVTIVLDFHQDRWVHVLGTWAVQGTHYMGTRVHGCPATRGHIADDRLNSIPLCPRDYTVLPALITRVSEQ